MENPYWTDEEDNALRRLYPTAPQEVIQEALDRRTWEACKSHAKKLRLKRPKHPMNEKCSICNSPIAINNKSGLCRKCWKREDYHQARAKVFQRLGGKCVWCGNDDVRVLQIDHIHGGGGEELRRFPSRTAFYKHLLALNDKELMMNYQSLCANCNQIKRLENKENRRPVCDDRWA